MGKYLHINSTISSYFKFLSHELDESRENEKKRYYLKAFLKDVGTILRLL